MTWLSLQLLHRSDKFRAGSNSDVIAVAVLVPELETLRNKVPFACLEGSGWKGEDQVDPEGTASCFPCGSESDADVPRRRGHRQCRSIEREVSLLDGWG